MINIISVKEAIELDKKTLAVQKITELDLIKRAGEALYKCFLEKCHPKKDDKIVIISGPGNNGADSLVLGSYLLEYDPIFIVCNHNPLLNDLVKKNAKIYDLNCDLQSILTSATLIIDGLFGTGLNKEVEGKFYHLIEMINQSNAYIFSIDIPSGLDGDNGVARSLAVKADFTAIIQYYKVGNILNDALDYTKSYEVIDIGLEKIDSKKYLLPEYKLPPRLHNTHKYHYGSVLVYCGRMQGAALLSAISALRSGSGLSTILTHKNNLPYISRIYPEIIIEGYDALDEIDNYIKYDAIVFGPGLGKNDQNNLLILEKIFNHKLIIDADGLFYFKQLKKRNWENVIITPHYQELANFLDIDIREVRNDPTQAIKKVIDDYHCCVVLKGPTTIIACNDEFYFSPYGNPGMATAGSGDVLSGIIASFVGRNYSLFESAKMGIYFHSLAGMYAQKENGEESLIATDIINGLKKALN